MLCAQKQKLNLRLKWSKVVYYFFIMEINAIGKTTSFLRRIGKNMKKSLLNLDFFR